YRGHPVGCAMALASLHELESKKLVSRSAEMVELFFAKLRRLAKRLGPARSPLRGRSLMLAPELFDECKPAKAIALTVTNGKKHISRFTRALGQALEDAYS
ncbi:MAG: hypothetical protein VYE14_08105, partial [Verrucomicrobiota bacterium]|nr:hypothetical protein [Verrucomicrobiota bacterium]